MRLALFHISVEFVYTYIDIILLIIINFHLMNYVITVLLTFGHVGILKVLIFYTFTASFYWQTTASYSHLFVRLKFIYNRNAN